MFRKAQLKLFAIIAGILLAVFIAVLGSINLIMKFVMENQSRSALKQIAASVEYDDTAMEFYYTPPGNESEPPKDPRNDHGEVPPFVPDIPTVPDITTSLASTTTLTVTSVSTTTVETTEPTEAVTEATIPPTEFYTEAEQTEAPVVIIETEPTVPPVVTHRAVTPVQPVKTTAVQTTAPKPPAVTKPTPKVPDPPVHEDPHPHKDRDDDNDDDDDDKKNNNDSKNNGQQGWQNPYGGWYGFGPCPDPGFGYWGGYYPPYPYYWGYKPKDETPPDNIEKNDDDDDDDDRKIANVSMTDDTGHIMPLGNISDVTTTAVTTSRPASATLPKKKFQNRRVGEPVPKSLGPTEFFIVMADESGNYVSKQNNDDLTDENAQKYITKILDSGESTGMLNNFQFYQQDKDNGTMFVFTDKTAEMDMLHKLTRTTIMIGSIAFILLSVVSFYLSGLVMKPLKIAFEKQKQFVSDASHELKTPVTVISANADVLAGEIGENKWLTYIKSQTERMNILVNDLLNLTRLENNTSNDFVRTDFDLSKAIVNTALPFECQAFESNKQFIVQVDDGIKINGSEKHIKQMAAIFIDNALKYSKDGGLVRVSLVQDGDKKILSVYNTGQGVKEEDKDKIFERFFRSDESRNRATGGYGLGLAIAKSIIDKHKFKVQVENVEGSSICFVVTMQ